ncbi:DUF115 domain-containing protein [Clostridiaceae bacterium 35-E11]
MRIYENNLDFMKMYAPVLYHIVTKEKLKYEAKIINIPHVNNFQITFGNKMCFANSQYNINQELEETFKYINKECEVLILFGIGNGEVIQYIKENFKSLKGLFVVEPFVEVFKRFVGNHSFRDIFEEMGLITFLVNKDENEASQIMLNVFQNEQYSSLEVVCLASYASLLENYYNVFKERVLRGFRTVMSQYVTLHVSRYKWLKNTISNFRFPHVDQEAVAPLLKGRPAVIVAAGPSLNKHFHLLEKLQKQAIFVGAGSAIKILNKRGILPQLRMAIDANPNEDIYDEDFYNTSEEVPLLYASQLYHDILPKYKGHRIFTMLPTDVLGQYIYRKLDKPYKLIRSGASVVHSALSFLCESGCNPIIFLGQDMCFYENELYAEGRESSALTKYDQRSWIEQKDIYGNKVYTLRNYLQIKYDYESMIKHYPNTRFINATEGGLGIEGTEIKPLRAVMEEDITEFLDLDFKQTLNQFSMENKQQIEEIKDVFEYVLEEINEVLQINKDRLKRLNKFKKNRLNDTYKLNRLRTDFKYIDIDIEKKLNEIEFYRTVVRNNISIQSLALKHKYKVVKGDELGNMEKGEKYLQGIITEVEVFCSVCQEYIKEYFEDANIVE